MRNNQEFAAKEKLEIVFFASVSNRGGRKGGSEGIPPAEPIIKKIGSDIFKYTPPVITFWILDKVYLAPARSSKAGKEKLIRGHST